MELPPRKIYASLLPEHVRRRVGRQLLSVVNLLSLLPSAGGVGWEKTNDGGGARAASWFRHLRWYVERRQQKVRENRAEELDGRRDSLVRS